MEEKVKLANYVVDTSGTLQQTRDQVEGIFKDLVIREARMKELLPAFDIPNSERR